MTIRSPHTTTPHDTPARADTVDDESAARETGGDVLVSVMRRHGIDTAFGVVSIHNLPLVEAVDRDLRFVPMRHEAAAVNAADGYARATGRIGVALTSTGTGAGNAAGSMIEALTAGSRVLHITGQIDSEFLSDDEPATPRGVIHEFPGQLRMLDAVSSFAARVSHADDAERVLEQAVSRILTAPHGPASVEWPSDFQYLAQPATQHAPDVAPGGPPAPEPAAIARAADLLGSARRPLFWLGGGAESAGHEIAALAHELGAGIVTSNSGRGIVPEDDDLVIGNFASTPAAEALAADADLLVAVGSHFRSNETKGYRLDLPSTVVQIDVDPSAIGRVRPATVGIVADAGEAVAALRRALGPVDPDPEWARRVTAVRESVRADLAHYIGGYAEICDALRTLTPRDTVFARDVTIPSSQWGNRLLPIYERGTNIFPLGGGIGQGLAMGIGAAHGRPDVPTVVVAGDGGLAVHLGELSSLAGSDAWCVVVVFNDGGYGVLRNMQEANDFRRSGVDLHTPRYDLLAAAMGMPYALAGRPGTFADEFASALALRGPALVEVDVTAIDPPPGAFVPPVHVPGAHR